MKFFDEGVSLDTKGESAPVNNVACNLNVKMVVTRRVLIFAILKSMDATQYAATS